MADAPIPHQLPLPPPEQGWFYGNHIDVILGLSLGVIGAVLGWAGLHYAIKAYNEAKAAKDAANDAARAAQNQFAVGTLIELVRDLQSIGDGITLGYAISALQETNTKLRRHLAPIRQQNSEATITAAVNNIYAALDQTNDTLKGFRGKSKNPADTEIDGFPISFAIQENISTICNNVADLTGLLEGKNLNR